MAFTIVTEAEITFMSGENVDATGNVTANAQFLHDYAAAFLSNLVKYDILTNWAIINEIYKKMFTEWAARMAGMQMILYNTAGYTDRAEAEDMINVHAFRMEQIEELLNEPDVQDFMGV